LEVLAVVVMVTIRLLEQRLELLILEAVAGAQLIATNLFQRTGADWRMIHHHASLLSAPRAASR
jgi:hypothetical protein